MVALDGFRGERHLASKTRQWEAGVGKWTHGPWKIDKELTAHAGEWLISLDRGAHRGMCIAETRPGTGNESANARLIAAAPELAEALEMMLRAWEEIGGTDELIGYQKGVAALAKANGGGNG